MRTTQPGKGYPHLSSKERSRPVAPSKGPCQESIKYQELTSFPPFPSIRTIQHGIKMRLYRDRPADVPFPIQMKRVFDEKFRTRLTRRI